MINAQNPGAAGADDGAVKDARFDFERAAASDKLFFQRFPLRRHRLRRADRYEIGQHAIANRMSPALPKGSAWFVLLRRVTAGVWVRIITANRADMDTDVSERLAGILFDIETTPASAAMEMAIIAAAVEAQHD